MILKFFKLAIEYPIPEWVTEGHPLWDAYWKCSKWGPILIWRKGNHDTQT